ALPILSSWWSSRPTGPTGWVTCWARSTGPTRSGASRDRLADVASCSGGRVRAVGAGDDRPGGVGRGGCRVAAGRPSPGSPSGGRSEEHTSELQSRENLVCRLLLE